MKRFLTATLILTSFMVSGYKRPETYVINAENNAAIHNNRGVNFLNENNFYPAIQEFKIAISLSPDTQASAVYYNNLGECYMKLGHPELAQDCFEKALIQFSLNFKYYQNLAQCYYQLGFADEQIKRSYTDKNPLGLILRGLLFEYQGDTVNAITTLDEFVAKEPDIMITSAVKQHLQELIEQTY